MSTFVRSEYQTGFVEFCGRKMIVDSRVLVPRAKTQTTARTAAAVVKQLALVHPSPIRVVDVGTGSGAIILTIAMENQECDIECYATDISDDALDVARMNAREYHQEENIRFLTGDLLQGLPVQPDVIVANLPYIPKGAEIPMEVQCEPEEAVFDDGDGTVLMTRLLTQINTYQTMPAKLIAETSPENMDKLIDLLQRTLRIQPASIQIHKDHEEFPRVLEVSWT